MGFKKHNWVKYGRKGIQCEIKVLDEDNRRLDFFRFLVSDKKAEQNIGDILKKTYNINFTPVIRPEESINAKKLLEES